MNPKPTVCLIIPALNEAETLPILLPEVLSLVDKVIVVDNGSVDATADIVEASAALLCKEPRHGYGQACMAGMALAQDFDIIVFLDADLSDDTSCLSELVEPIARGEADFVLSTRMGKESKMAMTFFQRNGNKLACFLMWCFWKTEYTDLGPFRAISSDALKQLGMKDCNYGWTVEMQIKAKKQNLRVKEITVPYRERIYGKSKVSSTVKGVIKAGSKILYVIFKERLKA